CPEPVSYHKGIRRSRTCEVMPAVLIDAPEVISQQVLFSGDKCQLPGAYELLLALNVLGEVGNRIDSSNHRIQREIVYDMNIPIRAVELTNHEGRARINRPIWLQHQTSGPAHSSLTSRPRATCNDDAVKYGLP